MDLTTLDPHAFKLLWLWIFRAEGRSVTIAELMALCQASLYLTRKAVSALCVRGLARASGQEDFAACELLLPAFSVFSLQISLQKNFFSQSEEEEELINLININTYESSSSEKIFFEDHAERLDALEQLARLRSVQVREELALIEHVTPDFVRAHACGFFHVEGREVSEAGMLRRRLLDGWEAPGLCPKCGGLDGERMKYVSGKFAEFIDF